MIGSSSAFFLPLSTSGPSSRASGSRLLWTTRQWHLPLPRPQTFQVHHEYPARGRLCCGLPSQSGGVAHSLRTPVATAAAQRADAGIHICQGGPTALKLVDVTFNSTSTTLLYDISTSRSQPVVAAGWRCRVFSHITHYILFTAVPIPGPKLLVWANSCVACQCPEVQLHTKASLAPFLVTNRGLDHVDVDLVGPLLCPVASLTSSSWWTGPLGGQKLIHWSLLQQKRLLKHLTLGAGWHGLVWGQT